MPPKESKKVPPKDAQHADPTLSPPPHFMRPTENSIHRNRGTQSPTPVLLSHNRQSLGVNGDSSALSDSKSSSGEVNSEISKKISTVSCEVMLGDNVDAPPKVLFNFHDERFATHINHQGRHISSYALILQTVVENIDCNNLCDAEKTIHGMFKALLPGDTSLNIIPKEDKLNRTLAKADLSNGFMSKERLQRKRVILQQLKAWASYERAVKVKNLANNFLQAMQLADAVTYSKGRIDRPDSNEGNKVKHSIYTLNAYNIYLSEGGIKKIQDACASRIDVKTEAASSDLISPIKFGFARLLEGTLDIGGDYNYHSQDFKRKVALRLGRESPNDNFVNDDFVAELMFNLFDLNHHMKFDKTKDALQRCITR